MTQLAWIAWMLLSAGPRAWAGPPAGLAEAVVFVDVTEEAGIQFLHSFGDDHMSSILEATGSGCAFFDYDGNGLPDLYVVNGSYLDGISDPAAAPSTTGLTNLLYRNIGGGRFTDATAASRVGDRGYGMGCAVGDYDNDGHPDLYVTNYGRNSLYRNEGNGRFRDVTTSAAVGDTLWGAGVTFFDYDGDGDLDLYVGNYLEFDPDYRLYYEADQFPGPLAYPGQRDALFRNDGDGVFSDVTEASGVLNEGRAMGVTAADYNGDGLTDLFVANDAMANYLYRNDGGGSFTEVALVSGIAFSASGDASSSMGGAFADFDRDGDLDLVVPDMAYNNLYVNVGDGYFDDRTAELGLAEVSGQYVSWHSEFLDYDNDGDADLFISNGDAHRLDTQEALLLANVMSAEGGRAFEDVSGSLGDAFLTKCVSRGSAAADYDNDGDLDLFLVNLDRLSKLWRNDGGNAGNWLQLALEGTVSNRDGIGTRIEVRAGDLIQTAERRSGGGYLSQSEGRVHFGLGTRSSVDEIVLRWPSGIVQRLADVAVNQVIEVREPEPAAEWSAAAGEAAGR